MAAHSFFLSYSAHDGTELAHIVRDGLQKYSASFKIWMYDERQRTGQRWDTQIRDAIGACAGLIFLMTPKSVRDNSVCHEEWTLALKYKKPVLPLLGAVGVEAPFRLHERQYVDFTGNNERALDILSQDLEWQLSPEGELKRLDDQLQDALIDLRSSSCSFADRVRIEAEVKRLQEDIGRQKSLLHGSERSRIGQDSRILKELMRERRRRPVKRRARRTKVVNVPPTVPPRYFQNRFVELQLITQLLSDPSIRMVTVVGRSGVGKTALVCKLLQMLEDEGGSRPFSVDGIVYLGERSARRIRTANIFSDLASLAKAHQVSQLEALYRKPGFSVGEKFGRLAEGLSGTRMLLVLDNFEDLLSPETRQITDSDLDETLKELLSTPFTAIQVLVTSRIAPRALALTHPERQRRIDLDVGLESPYAEQILRSMDADGHVGLRDAPASLLEEARKRTQGIPRALEALFAILSADRETSLEAVLQDTTQLLPESVMEALVGEAYRRLDPGSKTVMQGLAIFNRPVSPAALDYLLQPFSPGLASASLLGRLVNMHFVRSDADRYFLHPADRKFALDQIPLLNEGSSITLLSMSRGALFDRAANYFIQTREPEVDWKSLRDVQAIIDEFDVRLENEDFTGAADTIGLIDEKYLLVWGYFRETVSMHRKLEGCLTIDRQVMYNLACLGKALSDLGPLDVAIAYLVKALALARGGADRAKELDVLSNLASTCKEVAQFSRALDLHKQAISLASELGNEALLSWNLGEAGFCYRCTGKTQLAVTHYKKALALDRVLGNRSDESAVLRQLGVCYGQLGEAVPAISYLRESLHISRALPVRRRLCLSLYSLAEVLLDSGEAKEPIRLSEEAILLADEISGLRLQCESRLIVARAFCYVGDWRVARTHLEEARKFDYVPSNSWVSIYLGVTCLRQGDCDGAAEAFRKARQQVPSTNDDPDNFNALDARALADAGMCVVGDQGDIASAVADLRLARSICADAGVINRLLRLIAMIDPVRESLALVKMTQLLASATEFVEPSS